MLQDHERKHTGHRNIECGRINPALQSKDSCAQLDAEPANAREMSQNQSRRQQRLTSMAHVCTDCTFACCAVWGCYSTLWFAESDSFCILQSLVDRMDDFLRALDVGRFKRVVMTKLVQTLNGKSKLVIRQVGNDITFTTFGPNNPEGTANRYVVGKRDNINENAFLGKTLIDLYWETSTDERRVLVGDMQKVEQQLNNVDALSKVMNRRFC